MTTTPSRGINDRRWVARAPRPPFRAPHPEHLPRSAPRPTYALAFSLLLALLTAVAQAAPNRWPVERAQAWQTNHPWLSGCNYLPSSAINQLEMWQAATFDEPTIDRELGWAESLGFTSLRVFLHDLAWKQDPDGFLQRIDRFLALAEKHHLGVLFTIFDSCWHPLPKIGPQPAPIPFTHNSGWVQSPGIEVLQHPEQQAYLRDYVHSVLTRFAADPRIHGWDLWNEPDNFDGGASARPGLEPKEKVQWVLALLPQVFAWAREANPTQPLTSAPWQGDWSNHEKLSPMARAQIENSDVISFHNYGPLPALGAAVEQLGRYGRPLLCTEFMARGVKSFFDPNLGFLKEKHVAGYCWGFVSGKSQTIYPWDSWKVKYSGEPPLWFHDIFRTDGAPYRTEEVAYIRKLTGKVSPAAAAGTYRNPVLRGDYPDPSVVRVGEDYYATATSSEWAPEFPILHSTDLVNWSVIGAVFQSRPAWAEKNFWAPEITHWHGRFYVYYVARRYHGPLAIGVATAEKPAGPWSDHGPLISQPAGSIDPMAVEDESGQRWLVWKEDGNSRKQPTPIWAQRLNEDGTKLEGEMHELLRNDAPWEGPLIEGPYVLRRGDWFYLFYSGNACCGRGCNYGLGVARSKKLLGPWEKFSGNPILATNEHFRGPGHGSVVTDAQGRFFLLYHSYSLPSFIYTGRELMLDEVTFGADGWPAINSGHGPSAESPSPTAHPHLRSELAFEDRFQSADLEPGWQWPVAQPYRAVLAEDGLTLAAPDDAGSNPLGAVVARSCTSGEYTATTVIDSASLKPGVQAGLSAFGDPANAVGLSVADGQAIVWRLEKGQRQELAKISIAGWPQTYLRMRVTAGAQLAFEASPDGASWTPIPAPADGAYLPPWDRALRIALSVGGHPSAKARFVSFNILPLLPP